MDLVTRERKKRKKRKKRKEREEEEGERRDIDRQRKKREEREREDIDRHNTHKKIGMESGGKSSVDELFSAAEANIAVLQQFVHQHPQQENKQPYAHNHKQDELRAENKRLKEATRASQAEVKRLKNQIQLDQQARGWNGAR